MGIQTPKKVLGHTQVVFAGGTFDLLPEVFCLWRKTGLTETRRESGNDSNTLERKDPFSRK